MSSPTARRRWMTPARVKQEVEYRLGRADIHMFDGYVIVKPVSDTAKRYPATLRIAVRRMQLFAEVQPSLRPVAEVLAGLPELAGPVELIDHDDPRIHPARHGSTDRWERAVAAHATAYVYRWWEVPE